MTGKRLTTISGVPPHIARKVCRYAFGSHFYSLDLNQKQATYDVMLIKEVDNKELDTDHVKDFADFWGIKQWKFFFLSGILCFRLSCPEQVQNHFLSP